MLRVFAFAIWLISTLSVCHSNIFIMGVPSNNLFIEKLYKKYHWTDVNIVNFAELTISMATHLYINMYSMAVIIIIIKLSCRFTMAYFKEKTGKLYGINYECNERATSNNL